MPTLLLTLTTVLVAPPAPVEAVKPMPSASALVDEALAALKHSGGEIDFYTGPLVMYALSDSGRLDEAQQLILNAEDEGDRDALEAVYQDIVLERDGVSREYNRLIDEAPDDDDDKDQLLFKAVEELIKRHQLSDAEEYFERLANLDRSDEDSHSLWLKASSAASLAQEFLAAGDRDRARKYVQVWLGTHSRGENVSFNIDLFGEELLVAAIKVGETKAIANAIETSAKRSIVEQQSNYGRAQTAKWFASSGRWWTAIGDRMKAERAFANADRIAKETEAAGGAGHFGIEYMYIHLAREAGKADFATKAETWRQRLVELASTSEETRARLTDPVPEGDQSASMVRNVSLWYQGEQVSLIAGFLSEQGDFERAEKLLEMPVDPDWHVRTRYDIVDAHISHGNLEQAKSYLDETKRELDRSDGQYSKIPLLQDMAKRYNALNDGKAVDRCLQEATRLAGDDDRALRQLAMTSLEIGRYQQSYMAIHRVSDRKLQEFALLLLAYAYGRHQVGKPPILLELY